MNLNIFKTVLSSSLILFFICTSCELTTSVDEVQPEFVIPAEEAITDENSAELALIGVYSRMTQSGIDLPTIFFVPDFFIGFSNAGFFGGNEEAIGWVTNDPILTSSTQHGGYTRFYELINMANWVIDKTSDLSEGVFETSGRRTSLIAEARLMRALAHFYLLRGWGEFYDTSSPNGVVVRKTPARSAEVLPRSTVQETYTTILEDIEDGIANAPDNRGKMHTNKTFARAFKAKVLLYMGDFAEAATEAKAALDSPGPGFALEADYASIFQPHTDASLFTKDEILFGIAGAERDLIGWGNFYDGFAAGVEQSYFDLVNNDSTIIDGQVIYYDGGRVESITDPFGSAFGGPLMTKYSDRNTFYEMHYIMRMAELYLIHAEAEARAAGSVTPEALNSLNAVRIRAGATSTGGDGFETYPASISLADFLEAVRIEKLVELYAENGENWYDVVRYAYADGGFDSGFQVSKVKPAATDPNKFIFPMPQVSIDANPMLLQNPGYQ